LEVGSNFVLFRHELKITFAKAVPTVLEGGKGYGLIDQISAYLYTYLSFINALATSNNLISHLNI